MRQWVRNALNVVVSMAVLGTVFVVGTQSFAPHPAAGSATTVAALPANGFTDVAKAVTPAVVNITTVFGEKISGRGGDNDLRDRMEEFFGPNSPFGPFGPKFRGPQGPQGPMEPRGPRGFRGGGQGSGVIVSSDGYILTNNHVIRGFDQIDVGMADGTAVSARIVGTDAGNDLAVPKIDVPADKLQPATLGDSSKVRAGELVIAVGNPFGIEGSVTQGIVSGVGRTLGGGAAQRPEEFIQTDAAINPGNSGGPLVNVRGEVIGINSAIASETGYYAGYGFAIPVNLAREVMRQIIETGKVQRAIMGIQIRAITPEDADTRNPAFAGYTKGVPMGGDLGPAPEGKAPTFLVAALKDPIGANLDRYQIVKGWLDEKGEVHEQVFDIVWGDAEKRRHRKAQAARIVLFRRFFADVPAAYQNLMALATEKIRFLSTRRCRHS